MRDYYEVLGVARDASQEEIKKAYRKRARKLHPDYAGADSEEAFKELSVAYETLSDPEKRQMYDIGGPDGLRGGGAGAGAPFTGFSDIFEAMFSGGFGASAQGPASRVRRGKDQQVTVDITLEDATFGAAKEVSFKTHVLCDTCHGAMCQPGTSPERCATCQGSGFVMQVQNSLFGRMQTQAPCPTCQGYGSTIAQPCTECNGAGRIATRRTLNINIPAGASEGTQIRVSGEAEIGMGGGPNGDLYLMIHEKKHPVFDRRGDDLHTWITIPMTTAALGTEFELETMDGKKTVTINAGTQPNDDIVLEGLGVGHLQRSGRGAMHVHVDVEIPKKLDETSRVLLEQLAKAHKGLSKWEGVARAAAKQSRRAFVPTIEAVMDSRELASWVASLTREAGVAFVCHEEATVSLGAVLAQVQDSCANGGLPARIALIVGPEGGIGPEETALLVAAGARTIGLGANVLRSSTAGAVALTLIRAAAGAY